MAGGMVKFRAMGALVAPMGRNPSSAPEPPKGESASVPPLLEATIALGAVTG